MLNNIETGRGNPSYVSLVKLSKALGLPFSAFYGGEARPGERLVPKLRRRRLEFMEGNIAEVLTADFQGPQVVLKLTFPPHYDPKTRYHHPGQSFLHVLRGTLIVRRTPALPADGGRLPDLGGTGPVLHQEPGRHAGRGDRCRGAQPVLTVDRAR